MQLRFPWSPGREPGPPTARHLLVAGEPVPVVTVRHRRARRYVLRVAPDGSLRLTVPRGGSIAGALRFASGQIEWIVRERRRQREQARPWDTGTVIWYRGNRVTLAREGSHIKCGEQRIALVDATSGVRTSVEVRLRELADKELTARCVALAASRRLPVHRVAVRNYRSRWGACSARGVITLNWRLIQMPPLVSDYIIWHELSHLGHPNHGPRFWRAVGVVCPTWREGERWLRKHGRELL